MLCRFVAPATSRVSFRVAPFSTFNVLCRFVAPATSRVSFRVAPFSTFNVLCRFVAPATSRVSFRVAPFSTFNVLCRFAAPDAVNVVRDVSPPTDKSLVTEALATVREPSLALMPIARLSVPSSLATINSVPAPERFAAVTSVELAPNII